MLHAGWLEVALAAGLGLVVGELLVEFSLLRSVQAFLPVMCAFAVSVVVLLLARTELGIDPPAPLVAPLVTFLPGALLTSGVIELTTGQMLSGAGRLAAGMMQLVLLAFGIIGAAQLVGVPASGFDSTSGRALGTLAPWVGVAIYGFGVLLHHCGKTRTWLWVILVLYVAYAGQVVGGLVFGGVLSGFVGAAAMTPVAMFAAEQPSGPPMAVSFLPGYWLLVPGAAGLLGVTQYLGQQRVDGVTTLVNPGGTMVSISFGVLLGPAVSRAVLALVHRRAAPAGGTAGPTEQHPS